MRVKVPAPVAISAAVAILCGIAAIYVNIALYQSYIERTAYPAYLETIETGPNSVGSRAEDSTTHAASLAEIQQYDRFALEVIHYKSADVVEGQRYYSLTLANGEIVIGRLDTDKNILGIGKTESGDALYLLPVSRWAPLELPAGYTGALTDSSYADTTHYVECVGDELLTVGEFTVRQPSYGIMTKLWIAAAILAYIVCYVFLQRRKKAKEAAQNR